MSTTSEPRTAIELIDQEIARASEWGTADALRQVRDVLILVRDAAFNVMHSEDGKTSALLVLADVTNRIGGES